MNSIRSADPLQRRDVRWWDVAVVGAGPAGLSAAVHAADAGLSVVLVDAGAQPGGQYWRHPDETHPVTGRGSRGTRSPATESPDTAESEGQHDWRRFTSLRSRLYALEAAGALTYLRGTQVWMIERAPEDAIVLRLSPTLDTGSAGAGAGTTGMGGPRPDAVHARHVILCPGGYDRQLPIPGWDLPGVLAAGGAQALGKGNRTATGKVAVVAGTGPFLLPVATGLASLGVRVAAICEANSPLGWLRNLRGALHAGGKALEGAGYAAALARYRIPYKTRTVITAISGADRVESVTLARVDANGTPIAGTLRTVPCDTVALGWGFTPQVELVLAAGAETMMDVDGSLVAVVDERLASTVPGITVAGEATGVGGAPMAVLEGELAARCVVAALRPSGPGARTAVDTVGAPARPEGGAAGSPAERRIRKLQRERARMRRFAVAMHRANPVPGWWTDRLTPETLVCRCEEVTYRDLREAQIELGAQDARTLKSLARPGMGWCQGRVCGYAVAGIAAAGAGRPVSADDLRSMGKRPLAVPVTLGRLAALNPGDGAGPAPGSPAATSPVTDSPVTNFPATTSEG